MIEPHDAWIAEQVVALTERVSQLEIDVEDAALSRLKLLLLLLVVGVVAATGLLK